MSIYPQILSSIFVFALSAQLLAEPAICFKPAALNLDENLNQYFARALGLDESYPLNAADLLRLPTHLDCSHQGIQSLSGIEYAHNTEILNLAYNKIQDIRPLLGLPNLKAVTLAHNEIDYSGSSAMIAAVLALQDEGVWVDYAVDAQTPLEDFNDDALMLSKHLIYNAPTPGFEAYQSYMAFPGELLSDAMDSAYRPKITPQLPYPASWLSDRFNTLTFLISDSQNPPTFLNIEDAYRLRSSLFKQNLNFSEGRGGRKMNQNFTLEELLERVEKDLMYKYPNSEISENQIYEQAMKILTTIY